MMMGDLQVKGIKKLNTQNYKTWSTCMKSYLQGQDLWDVVGGTEVNPPEDAATLKKWNIKAGKATFAIKTTIDEEMLEHISIMETPKKVWDTFTSLFSKKNDARLQFLENELLSITQREKTINQYFTKVKFLCCEISELDPTSAISESRMRRIIIHGLKSEYRSFIAAIQGWAVQPSLIDLESMLASQEALAKQISEVTIKSNNGEALFSGQRRGHYARECRCKKKIAESNAVTSQAKSISEEEGDAETCCATTDPNPQWTSHVIENEVLTLHAEEVNYENDWIADSGCSKHMTGDKRKLQNTIEYKGSRVVVTANNLMLPIAHVGKTMIVPHSNSNQVELDNVFYVTGMKKNLVSVSQLTSADNFVVFGLDDVKVYHNLKVSGSPLMEGRRMDSIYVMSAKTAYVNKMRKNETADLWHARLGHESKFRAKQPLELMHSNVFGPVKKSSISGMRYMVTFIDDFSRYVDAALATFEEPTTYEEVSQSIQWRKVMEEEVNALKKNHTWDLVLKPKDVKPISCKWVYKVKTRADGTMERYKARLVIRGFSQQYGLDYDETFSPVAKLTTVRVSLTLTAKDHDTRRSTTRYLFKLGYGAVSWCSKRQLTVALSTTEAEYRAAAMAAQENMWIKQLMKDLRQEINHAAILYYDNLSAICLAENPVFHARTKHVEVHYHFIREKVLQEEIEMKPIKTEDQIADIFTKYLQPSIRNFCNNSG
ncbi:Integrase, catalytic core [Cucumis melo var. makuwa]|uniref:Integrase, catalytic core n=1 Tax=Cucumis melo var. makuwa TaxID=1194695 RepID=A0A5A7T1U9_CUCMM|nr:Integrase, catalytic core [Cucumis melo var. makuwa]TYJ97557.1 Integrase, catalytic core [Cucumis melo var. makuwa]